MNIFYRMIDLIWGHPINPRKRMRTFKGIFLLVLLSSISHISAQDIHFTQFYNTPLNINPALTGVFGGDTRFLAGYRSQWTSVPVDYRTFVVSVDHKFYGKQASPGFFSGGLSFNFDQSGYSRLTYLNLGLHGSYTRKLTQHFYTTVGVQGSAVQRQFDLDDLTFDNFFDPDVGQADPSLGSGENFLDNNANNFFDFSAGINFRLQALSNAALVDRLEKRSSIDFGVGLFHLNRPNQSFVEDAESPLSIRVSPYFAGVLQLGPIVDLIGVMAVQFQRPYDQYLAGAGARVYLNRSLGKQIAIQGGVNVRFHQIADSYSPTIQLHYNNWRFGFSYDVNVSEFQVATDNRSGPEFTLRYIIRRVKPLPTFKICPLI